MNRKFFIAALAAASLTTPALAAELSFTSWGGAYQEVQEKTAVKPFGAKEKVNVKSSTYNGGIAQIRAQVQTGSVSWDVVDIQLADAIRACDEGLLEKISPADLAAGKDGSAPAQDFMPNSLNDCMAGLAVWSTVLSYDKTKVGAQAPTKVADFFDLKKYPGKRALRKSPEGAMEWALVADGVKPAEVYKVLGTPAGVARAFKKLDTIKASIVWWEAGAQPPQLLADGEVVMTSAYANRIYDSIAVYKKPFDFIWDAQLTNVEGYAIVKGSRNLKEAKAFVRFATEATQQAALGSLTGMGPVRKSAAGLVDPKVQPYMPTNPKNLAGALGVDFAFWADHGDDLNQKFAAWLGQK
ncbi:MAG: hypothetical protein RLY78_1286 [Pseudomonadota bacterium]|uniref:ABC transporter substrate-binding protein n=1 Tax=Pseudaquabacterium rugosum TaxID=2984194 RepID=A0ABU9B7W2_9BURK